MRKFSGFVFVALILLLPPLAFYYSDQDGFESAWKQPSSRYLVFVYLIFALLFTVALVYEIIKMVGRKL